QVLSRGDIDVSKLALNSLLLTAVLFGVRLAWMYTVPYAAAKVDRRIAGARPVTDPHERLLLGLSGMRGAVSVAAALAIPQDVPPRGVRRGGGDRAQRPRRRLPPRARATARRRAGGAGRPQRLQRGPRRGAAAHLTGAGPRGDPPQALKRTSAKPSVSRPPG